MAPSAKSRREPRRKRYGTDLRRGPSPQLSGSPGSRVYKLVVRSRLRPGHGGPDSASGDTGALGWTKDDRLFFTRNIVGEGVHIKIAEDGGLGPSSVAGIMKDADVTINPACG